MAFVCLADCVTYISKWCQSPPRVIVPATLCRDEFRVRYSPPFHITENYAMARNICVFIISKLTVNLFKEKNSDQM